MPNACLYLHELIDIVGTGSEAYKAHTGRLGTGRSDGGAPLVGTWQQSGSTGTWPVVVNLWEMRGWDHWSEILERQYTRASGQEPHAADVVDRGDEVPLGRLRPHPRAGAVLARRVRS